MGVNVSGTLVLTGLGRSYAHAETSSAYPSRG